MVDAANTHPNSFEISVSAKSSKENSLNFLKKEWTLFSNIQRYSFSSIKMPKKVRYYNLMRSPHVNKKSRETFSICLNKEYFTFKCFKRSDFTALFLPLKGVLNSDLFLKVELKVQKV